MRTHDDGSFVYNHEIMSLWIINTTSLIDHFSLFDVEPFWISSFERECLWCQSQAICKQDLKCSTRVNRLKKYFNSFPKRDNFLEKKFPLSVDDLSKNQTYFFIPIGISALFNSAVTKTSILFGPNFERDNARRKLCSLEQCFINISNCIKASKWNVICMPLSSTTLIVHMSIQLQSDRNVVCLLPSLISN